MCRMKKKILTVVCFLSEVLNKSITGMLLSARNLRLQRWNECTVSWGEVGKKVSYKIIVQATYKGTELRC